MSDAARQNLKVSREGIVLIKSFEGFRPRAIQRENGGWIIGYGHTLSAREGASVSEADAELLLRYDLLPVEKSVNEAVPGDLNQHQFDALVSFAFSVGVDRFAESDVRQRLNAGAPGEAADAMMGWPEPALPETALRRRAAERALFVANPSTPVALSDLLAAPLPPPAVVVPVEEPQVETPVETPPEAQPETQPEIVSEPETAPAAAAPVEEPQLDVPVEIQPENQPETQPETVSEPETAPAAVVPFEEPQVESPVETQPETQPQIVSEPEMAPAADVEPAATVDPRGAAVAALLGESAARIVQIDAPPAPSNDNPPAEVPSETDAVSPTLAEEPSSDESPLPEAEAEAAPDVEPETDPAPTFSIAPVVDTAILNATRYAPYSATMVGPLPFLQPAAPRQEPVEPEVRAIDHAVVETTPPEIVETAAAVTEAATAPVEAVTVDPAPVAELVLTPLEDAPEPAIERPLWTPEERDAPDGSENNLFGEDLALTQGGGSIMRHEIEMEAPARFDWSETGPFIFMGGVGLVSFGASMAAFRRAAEQSGGNELTLIGWVLALIGLACVGVSSVNLYRKFGLPGGD